MEKDELIEKLTILVKPYVQNQSALTNITPGTSFTGDLKINSANLVDIILDIEHDFNIEIDNESMEKMITVGAAMDIISAKVSVKNDGQ